MPLNATLTVASRREPESAVRLSGAETPRGRLVGISLSECVYQQTVALFWHERFDRRTDCGTRCGAAGVFVRGGA